MKQSHRTAGSLWIALLALVSIGPAVGQSNDPSQQPIPNIEEIVSDPRRALVLEVLVESGVASLVDTYVSTTPPATNVGDPAQLRIRWFDADGFRIGSRSAWDPRWEFEWDDESDEQLNILPSATGAFAIPFSIDIASVAITETSTGLVLLDVDVRNTIQAYCQVSPEDPNCDGATGGMDDDGDGVNNDVDNCPADANPDQLDADGDNIGDVCDPDDDNDGVDDQVDNCPFDPNPNQEDADGDNIGDLCDPDTGSDTDGDGIANTLDVCPGTAIPEAVPTNGSLGKNRWALQNHNGVFTQAGPQAGTKNSFTLEDTRGCSCEQIVAASGLGIGQLRRGCSTSPLIDWVRTH